MVRDRNIADQVFVGQDLSPKGEQLMGVEGAWGLIVDFWRMGRDGMWMGGEGLLRRGSVWGRRLTLFLALKW